ncbi:carbohydrate kinase [Nocardioides sp. YIM 152315]|uniref:carbohydrate kinase family protein n=1 Tax=Nocardioides sp. YIM 152315 TaxID=3031760 RepID=UPI0023DAD9B8|nr:carbohydrate kinase [Nocardioides sp. YIM 152315]MDF1604755.1 carbohydrate kinase [Nocardioides sp. YIM 152315]
MHTDALVVGEALVDIVRAAGGATVEHPGGSAANVAVALARLGRPVRFATAWADDERGAVLARHLAAAQVELAADPHVLARTSTATATLGADGSATYEFDLEWRLGPVPTEPPPLVVHACSLGAVLEPGADAVLGLVERLRDVATISYDVNVRPAVTGTGTDVVDLVERMASRSDLVKASDEDLRHLYPGVPLAEAAAALRALGPAAVVVTRGGEGATWFGSGDPVDVASLPVTVADTIGAGDTFGAAVVDALWERGRLGAEMRGPLRDLPAHEVAEVLAHAARAAAVTVSRPGADPPYLRELRLG